MWAKNVRRPWFNSSLWGSHQQAKLIDLLDGKKRGLPTEEESRYSKQYNQLAAAAAMDEMTD